MAQPRFLLFAVASTVVAGVGCAGSKPVVKTSVSAPQPNSASQKSTSPAGKAPTISLGKVAQATQPTRIYSEPRTSAHVYYTTPKGDYLVVRDDDNHAGWNRVLLSDMHYGYARKKSIDVLNYEYRLPAPQVSAPPSGQDLGAVVVWQAQRYGRPGASPAQFVAEVYAKASGPSLPTSLDAQVKIGIPVKKLEDLKEGDRVYFWDSKRDRLGDAGIYSGNGNFIHLAASGVQTSYLGDKKWLKSLVAARR